MSGCQSLGSNYRSCSQSRKMSIGIVVDSLAKPHSGSTKKADSPGGSPWVTIGSRVQNLRTKDSAHNECKESTAAAYSFEGMTYGINEPTTTNSIPAFADGTVSPFAYIKQTECDRISLGTGGQKDLPSGRLQESTCAALQEACVPDKGATHKQPDRDNVTKDALRMKLLETLRTVPSENTQFVNSQTAAAGASDMMQEQIHEFHACLKNKPSSDSIETDSENPKFAIKKRMTRSLGRAKDCPTMQPRHFKTKAISGHKEGNQDNSIFSFEEKFTSAEPGTKTGGCFSFKAKNNDRKGSVIKASDKLFPSKDMNIERAICKSKKPSPTDVISLDVERTYSHRHSHQNENLETELGTQKRERRDFYCSHETNEKQKPGDVDKTASPQNADRRKTFSSLSPVAVYDDRKSTVLKMKRTVSSSPLCFLPQTHESQRHIHKLPLTEREFVRQSKFELKSGQNPSQDNFGSSTQGNFQDGSEQSIETPLSTSVPSTGEEDAGYNFLSRERRAHSNMEEVSSAKQAATFKRPCKAPAQDFDTFPETSVLVKPIACRAKRHRSHEGRGNGKDRILETSEQYLDDGLARAVSLLGLALEGVQCKMTGVTNRRCSDILVSASEEVHLQLQNVESLIQRDMEMLTRLNKSKRKCLETSFQEHQDRLKLMHEKFKEEINRFTEDYRSTVRVLEAQQIELKGAVGKQRASHRKLLLQLEEEIGSHLNDAQRRILSVQKMRKEKMQQFKLAVTECLKDIISS